MELRRSRGARALRLHASLFTVSDDCLTHTHGSSSERTHSHPRSNSWAHLFDSFLRLSTSSSSSCLSPSSSSTSSCSLSSTTRSSMANLRCSAAEESEDTLNSFTSLTGYEPNLLTFGELNDSSVPFSFMIPSTDQDVDDVTLGEMLTAAHRGQVDYCVPGGL